MANFLLDHDVPERLGEVIHQAGHLVKRLREVLPVEALDVDVLEYACRHELILVTCNRDDFLTLAKSHSHAGIVILIRRKSRIAECAALLQLIEKAGESGLLSNINFA